jgi:hypothetical protein
MDAPTTRILRPARIVALALIGLVVLGLAYLRFAPDGDSSSVPAGAKAGDLTLERCDYATEDGGYAADCGTLVVPENRHDPDSRLIALPVKRIRAQSANARAPEFIWSGGRLLDAWPLNPDHKLYNRVRDSNVETLLVGGELDFSTPPQVATRELLPHLRNGQQVVLPKLGHTEDFWANQPAASTRLIDTFLDTGRIDTSLYTENRVDFTPSLNHETMAKIALGTMLGLAALTLFSLLWMALRVRRRGPFGRKASGVLRSVYALVLGLGGLLLGMLIALTALPTVPLYDELLATVSVGVPLGLGIYFAWVNGDWGAKTKATGFAAALAGALVGAWLGFNATEVPVALLSGIVGAAVGGNLTLLVLDIAWDWQARNRFADTKAKGTLEARPVTG